MFLKKSMKAGIALVIALSACLSVAGCGGGDEGSGNQSILYVGNCNNGFGQDWIAELEKNFEEKYKDTSFEDDKVGVDVRVNNSGTQYTGTTYINSMSKDRTEVVFLELAMYTDYVAQGKAADISDIVKTPLTEYGETRSIWDKLDASQWEGYLGFNEGKIYGLPWWSGIQGAMYDADLFKKYGLYFAKGGCPSEAYAEGGSYNGDYAYTGAGEKSAGPDHKYGTYDDGLPCTYGEFWQMCENMKNGGSSITPFNWTGQYEGYADMLTRALWYNNVGIEGLRTFYGLSGQATDIVDSVQVDANGYVDYDSITYKRDEGKDYYTIDENNAYEALGSFGKLASYDFIKRLVAANYATKTSWQGSVSHTTAQKYFLDGDKQAKLETSAMLVDGSWWMSEAMRQGNLSKEENITRDLRYMPLPKPDKLVEQLVAEGKENKQTVASSRNSYVFINANCKGKKLELAKQFFRYVHSDEALKIFNKHTGGIRPFDFTYTETDLANPDLGNFAKSMYQVMKNYDQAYLVSGASKFINNETFFVDGSSLGNKSTINVGGKDKTFEVSIFALKRNPSVTAKDIFEGCIRYYKDRWTNLA